MRLGTIRRAGATAAVRLEGDEVVEVGHPDVGALLALPSWPQVAGAADGTRHPVSEVDWAPLIPRPEKIICVGLNYAHHIQEMGHEPPDYPTLFAKYTPALIGAYDDIVLPEASAAMDWEVELAVIIGRHVRRAGEEEAAGAIAGYSVVNDITARDWQQRTSQFLQGKTFEATTPLGPWLVTSDDPAVAPGHWRLWCEVDGERVQEADTADLVFPPAALVSYCSTVMTLSPGDVIATGTPGGVGAGRRPPRFLADTQEVVTVVEGIGEMRNRCRQEKR
jgi:acylpyruvate hydrolase